MDVLPIGLKLTNQKVLLIGGGSIAYRKACLIAPTGPAIYVLSPYICDELAALVTKTGGKHIKGAYPARFSRLARRKLKNYRLVIAATDSKPVNARVFKDCERMNLLVNAVDDPPNCRFIVPAIVDRSPLIISIATGGRAPVIARQVRTQLESTIPARMGDLVQFSGEWRAESKAAIKDPEIRRVFWENVYAGPAGQAVLSGDRAKADALMPGLLKDFREPEGEVYLVGAGPGDPELLTFKALRLMQQADVVLYDRLVSPEVMNLVRRDAERIYVGKAKADHAVPQPQINELLVEHAKQGKRVCRLKGGDPFIFGRGGEEIETLFAKGVKFQVVPGITAAAGCGAYAGIPLTHRDYAQSVRFLTGHLKDGTLNLPWGELVFERQTLVIYMGLGGLAELTQKLIDHGMRSDMPCALISKGTLPDEEVLVGTVSDIAVKVANHELPAPTLTIIGEVVSLREKLKWRN